MPKLFTHLEVCIKGRALHYHPSGPPAFAYLSFGLAEPGRARLRSESSQVPVHSMHEDPGRNDVDLKVWYCPHLLRVLKGILQGALPYVDISYMYMCICIYIDTVIFRMFRAGGSIQPTSTKGPQSPQQLIRKPRCHGKERQRQGALAKVYATNSTIDTVYVL